MPGQCNFQESWLSHVAYKDWVAPDPMSSHRARCRPCAKTFDVSSMGESALKSHQRSAKHIGNLKDAASSSLIKYVTPRESGESVRSVPTQSSDLNTACKAHDAATEAEILWALKVVTSHYSYSSSAHTSELFRKMFPDSEVAKAFTCGEKKCAYLACHGLGPFFLSSVHRAIEKCDCYVVLFDESANDYLHQKQMDVHIRYWDASQRITTRYLTSVFMGHATADDIEDELLKALEPLPLAKILQVSMDGPNVNLKFFRSFQKHLHENYQVNCLDLGTCGLHVVHNAYRAGVTASKWGLDILLSSLGVLFQDSPARREDFSMVTGKTMFPLRYVAHRWVENVPVIERALALWPDVAMYIESARRKEVNQPKCASFQNLHNFCGDPLIQAKLNFALAIALILKPFLTEYQVDQPLVFFLARDLEAIVRKLLTKFLKCSVLSASNGLTGLLKINIEDVNNHTALEKVDIGHTAEQILKKSKVSAKEAFAFKMECKQFLLSVTKKVLEKSPLKFPLVRGLSSLDPRQMCTKPDQCLAGLKNVLNALIAAERLTDYRRDTVLAEYAEMLQMEKHKLRLFEKSSDRLDIFFLELLKFNSSYSELWRVVELLLVLSHGQATVERGFSVNKQVSVENLKSLSYIMQRAICDAVDKAGGILNIPITKELKTSVSSARHRYHAHLEEQKRKQQEEANDSKRRLVEDEIDNLRRKKVKLEATVADLTTSADELALKAEETGDVTYIVKSNSLRKTAKNKTQELLNINEGIAAKLLALS
ncbi:uncharacterized protein LOC125758087 [Rhipicephalus sanguineus]|uniref:uncharacterized protein LOC125758087 n=1 Tax=Rhipicephalus sanguineus TaxID=34632 RepID=UPI0020C2881A|nr:uncharacterized protein LOC125758087 [Rhipicephalus sanguineus]